MDPDELAASNEYYSEGDYGPSGLVAIIDIERALELGLEPSDHEAVEELLKELGQ